MKIKKTGNFEKNKENWKKNKEKILSFRKILRNI